MAEFGSERLDPRPRESPIESSTLFMLGGNSEYIGKYVSSPRSTDSDCCPIFSLSLDSEDGNNEVQARMRSNVGSQDPMCCGASFVLARLNFRRPPTIFRQDLSGDIFINCPLMATMETPKHTAL